MWPRSIFLGRFRDLVQSHVQLSQLHVPRGFEWSVGNRQLFTEMIEKEGWQQFFTCSTSGGEPWIYYLTNETIDGAPDRVGSMLDELVQFVKELPFELISQP